MLTTFILLGKLLEARAKRHTCSVLTQLMSMAPESASLVTLAPNGTIATEQIIDCRLVQTGDLLHVLAGQKVPADGEIVQACIMHSVLP
jgi:cation transport ATPase